MEIISFKFLGFVLITLVVYYLLSHKAQNIWLLITSYVFYAFWNVWFVAVIGTTTILNYFIAKMIWGNKVNKRGWVILGITIDVLALASLKFLATDAFVKPFGANLDLLIPIGFSFYILQAISYLLDVQDQRITASNNLVDFALYMAYFPKLVSGPIEHARTFLPQLASPRTVDQKKLSDGFTLIMIGLVRKIIFSHTLSTLLPADFFQNFADYSGFNLLLALIGYAFWLYNDFAGYTSLVRGISLLFGIELSPNFLQPYFSRTFTEFWNRWHISLSNWLRDYIFYPVNWRLAKMKSKNNKWMAFTLPPIITMLVSGLWHHFSPSMLLWGGMHAFYQIIERAQTHIPMNKKPVWKQILSGFGVFCLTLLAWVPFATGSVANTLSFYKIILGRSFFQYPGSINLPAENWILVGIAVLLTLIIDWAQYHWKDETIFNKIPIPAKSVLLAFTLFGLIVIIVIQASPINTFIYQGF